MEPTLTVAIEQLSALPRPFVDRALIEALLGVGRRRAQQILAPCVNERVGASGLAPREAVIARLRELSRGEEAHYEVRRRRKLAVSLDGLRREWIEHPRLLVEAPTAVTGRRLSGLPAGVRIEPGRITVEFGAAQEAIEKLLALAMAIGNDFDAFEQRAVKT